MPTSIRRSGAGLPFGAGHPVQLHAMTVRPLFEDRIELGDLAAGKGNAGRTVVMRRVRQDLGWLVSAGLLLSVLVTALTGVIADLWDLNDFWYHTVAGYVMGGLVVAHVLFN